MRPLRVLMAGLVLLGGCGGSGDGEGSEAPAGPRVRTFRVQVVAQIPHDPAAFTQGLTYDAAGRLFEGTGRAGRSEVRELDPGDGSVLRRQPLEPDLFGEGLAARGDELVQLTWRNGRALRWSVAGFAPRGEWTYGGEGWGLTSDRTSLLQSDGSPRITVRDPATFQRRRVVEVRLDGRPVPMLNELEAVGDRVWANVWQTTRIVRFDPRTGVVDAVADLAGLVPSGLSDPEAVANGIAHRPGDPPERLLVTGKLWPSMYVVDLR